MRRALLLMVIALAGCGGGGGSSLLSSYDSPAALRDKLAAIGVACDGFELSSPELGATASAECDSGDARLALVIYPNAETVRQIVHQYCPGVTGATGSYGSNWIVGGFNDPADEVADALGGDACG